MAYRVLIAQFMHETNTFSKLPTTLEDYRKRWLIEGEAMVPRFTGTKNEIGGYIERVVRNWDSTTLVERLELQVGKDLQFIRINGTLVGGLVGLLIFIASKWLALL